MQLDDILGKERKRIAMKKIQVKQQKQGKKERNDRPVAFVFPHASQLQAERRWSLLFNGGVGI